MILAIATEDDLVATITRDDLVDALEHATAMLDGLDEDEAENLGTTPEDAEALRVRLSDVLAILAGVDA